MFFHCQSFDLIDTHGEGFHGKELVVNMRKVEQNESVSLDYLTYVGWYVEYEVSMGYSEEAASLVGWGYKVILMDLQ